MGIVRYNEKEALPKFANSTIILKYFIACLAHQKINKIEPRICYIYCTINLPCEICEFNSKHNIIVFQMKNAPLLGEIYDDTNSTRKGCVQFYLVQRVLKYIGCYCPKFESLLLTDWTHSEIYFDVARQFLLKILARLKRDYNFDVLEKSKYSTYLPFTLGMDIEFEQLSDYDTYNIVVPRFKNGYLNDPISVDGSGKQIEIRPHASIEPIQIIKNIRHLIDILTKLNIPIGIKGDYVPLGAHIHLGHELFLFKTNREYITKYLDKYLGSKLLELSGRARGSYKILSAIREQPYGFEYRSIPSACLLTPQFTYIVLEITRRLVNLLWLQELKKQTYWIEEKLVFLDRELQKWIKKYSLYGGTAINYNWVPKEILNKNL